MPFQEALASFSIRESTLGRIPTNVITVARPSDRGQALGSTREFIIEVLPVRVRSVGNCSGRTPLIIRLLTKEQKLFLCEDCREPISECRTARNTIFIMLCGNPSAVGTVRRP